MDSQARQYRGAVRPLYETDKNRAAEADFARDIECATGWKLHKLGLAYQWDYLACNAAGYGVAVIELKCRAISSGLYGSLVLSLHKWAEAQRYRAVGLQAILFVRYTDCDVWLEVPSYDVRQPAIRMGGRTKAMRNGQDMEPVVYLPLEWFQRLQ